MDVKSNKGKYLKLLKFLRKNKLDKQLREKKGCLPYSIVEEAQRGINVTFSQSSVEKLGAIIQKYWKQIYEDVLSNEPDNCILTISRRNIAKRKDDSCEAITNYVVKTQNFDFLKGRIRGNLIKNALMEHLGVNFITNHQLNQCRIHVHQNFKEIKKAVLKRLQTDNNSEMDYDSDDSPIVNVSKKRRISPKGGDDSSFDTESVFIKSELLISDEEDKSVNDMERSSNVLKEVVIPLERIKIPAQRVSKPTEEKSFSRWFRMVSDEEFLHERKKEFLAHYQQKKVKLINECQMAVQDFITDCDQALEELFTNIQRSYRRQPNIKAL